MAGVDDDVVVVLYITSVTLKRNIWKITWGVNMQKKKNELLKSEFHQNWKVFLKNYTVTNQCSKTDEVDVET